MRHTLFVSAPLALSLLTAATTAFAQQPAAARTRVEAAALEARLAQTHIDPRVARQMQVSAVDANRSLVTQRDITADPPEADANPTTPVPAAGTTVANPELDAIATRVGSQEAANSTFDPAAAPVSLDLARIGTRIRNLKDAALFDHGVRVELSDSATHVPLQPGQILTVQREQAATPVSDQGVMQASSPSVLYTLDRQLRARELGLVHKTAGLSWDSDRGRFVGQILVGIVDRENVTASEAIDAAVTVQLLAPANAVQPAALQIRRIGQPFESVEVALDNPDDPFEVQLLSQVDPDLPPARMQVRRTRLVLSAPSMLDGLGVGSGEVTVRSAGARLRDGETFTLHLDNGELDTTTLTAGANGIARTRLRSTGLGSGTLRLEPGPYSADPVLVRFATPWLLIIATLLGSTLGTYVLVHGLRQRSPRRRRSYIPDAVAGLVIGVGATAMVYAGMGLPSWVPLPKSLAGAIAPFALSFFCAAAASALMHFLTGFRAPPAPAVPAPEPTVARQMG